MAEPEKCLTCGSKRLEQSSLIYEIRCLNCKTIMRKIKDEWIIIKK